MNVKCEKKLEEEKAFIGLCVGGNPRMKKRIN